jgi:redox-sensing transcriptional repressor
MTPTDSSTDLDRRVPDVTVERLSIYARILTNLHSEGWETVSSALLAARTPFTAAQIRRDLSWFGQFGTRGKGYHIGMLREELDRILGVNTVRRVALIGVGNLGSALLGYSGFKNRNFKIVAAFDTDMRKVGRTGQHGVQVYSMGELHDVVIEQGIEMAILAVPVHAGQAALDTVSEAGIRAVLNFAPIQLRAPENVRISSVDLAIEMEGLSYFLKQGAPDA